MDDFGLDRQELTGSLISMEFGQGGRVQQLWVSDPTLPDENEEYQFVCSPLNMGEEITEDYFPGTILLGIRSAPEDPWILSRNTDARPMSDEEDLSKLGFEYEMSLVEELRVTGQFYEIAGTVPQIAWDVEIENISRRSVEIGELAFPLAFNNVLDGYAKTDEGIRNLGQDRIHVHPFIGGSASHIFAQRVNGRPPGLLVFPGGDTRWEFYNHVPASLTTAYRWDGIPVVYVYSRAAIEREGWQEWVSGHTSTVLEPREKRKFSMRFVSANRTANDGVFSSLVACNRPAIHLLPAAVAPADVGIAIEIAGATPTRFDSDLPADLETDSDESGGFCFVKPLTPGPIKVSFEDVQDRESEVHLLLTEPIGDLICKRAEFITNHQVVSDPVWGNAIVPVNIEDLTTITDSDSFSSPFGIESGLADALFLAEKNTLYADEAQIRLLDQYLTGFFEDRIMNPGDGTIGSLLPNPMGIASYAGHVDLYPMAYLLYDAMARIAMMTPFTIRKPNEYLRKGALGLGAMARSDERPGVPLMSHVVQSVRYWASRASDDEQLRETMHVLRTKLNSGLSRFSTRTHPFGGQSAWSTTGFEEVALFSRRSRPILYERALRYAYAARSMAPSWWWYGSDKRWSEEPDAMTHPALQDKGELCLGPTSVANSLFFLESLDHDELAVDETKLRLAFGGMLGIWALVRHDGAAGMGFCPDASSAQYGMSWTTGDVGVGLFHYLRGVYSLVIPTRLGGVVTFGCHFESEVVDGVEQYHIRPWDGVGRRIVVRQLNFETIATGARIKELRIDARKREALFNLETNAASGYKASIWMKGMWGTQFAVSIDGHAQEAVEGGIQGFTVEIPATAAQSAQVQVKVIG